MKKEMSWRLARIIVFLPFLTFVPLTIISRSRPLFYFWGFFIYLTIWAIANSVVDRKYFPKHWKLKCVFRVVGVLGLQIGISFGIASLIFKDQYDVRGADGTLKTEQNQGMDFIGETSVD